MTISLCFLELKRKEINPPIVIFFVLAENMLDFGFLVF
jgi:hypothetical protein